MTNKEDIGKLCNNLVMRNIYVGNFKIEKTDTCVYLSECSHQQKAKGLTLCTYYAKRELEKKPQEAYQ